MTWREKMCADADHVLVLMPTPSKADKWAFCFLFFCFQWSDSRMDWDAEGFMPKEANMNDAISLNETVALKYEQMGFTDPASQSKTLTWFYIIQANKLLEMFSGKIKLRKFQIFKFYTLSDAVVCLFLTQEDRTWFRRDTRSVQLISRSCIYLSTCTNTSVITIFICQEVSRWWKEKWMAVFQRFLPLGPAVFRHLLPSLQLHFVVFFSGPKWDAV